MFNQSPKHKAMEPSHKHHLPESNACVPQSTKKQRNKPIKKNRKESKLTREIESFQIVYLISLSFVNNYCIGLSLAVK